MTVDVIALPGGIMPAALRYGALASALGDAVKLHLKDLEVYAQEQPPAGYSVAMEVDAVKRFADSLGLDRFHLLGYSGGGFMSLAFAGAHPGRLLSLALFEPASVPGRLSQEEEELDGRLRAAVAGLGGAEFMQAFVANQLRPGVPVPAQAGPPPQWMRTRPAGIAAMMGAFVEHRFDRASLRGCRFPVFLAYGDQTSEMEEIRAAVLGRLLPDVHIRRFEGLHHFAPPEDIYGPEHLGELRNLWSLAGSDRDSAGQ
ncbi:MAG: alpha/beta fold hydrolase [Candidatus Dormibacteraceae bacterium]